MAKDYVSIANGALSRLGDDRITDPADNSNAASAVRDNWETTRDAVLRAHPWNFAIGRAELGARVLATGETIFPYENAFQIPVDCMRLVDVLGTEAGRLEGDKWKREGSDILADTDGPIYIRYVRRITESGLWDDMFIAAFQALLAHHCCERITGGSSKKNGLWREYERELVKAKGVDAKEDPQTPSNQDSSWIAARQG